ncbi:GNAT family N-acetyltransferase [Roseateles amylovorans]|uniref:Acetyltransferase n=1 Tax=Roseateles amylovorans TaxID=2978473 RepID=A0ABY6AU69_9BURK|nr:GNAT family N-acetyltransferase [Roseateles amylovorans]UXH76217.1 acetyltransferase [Roseateles amylovorans]
MFDTPLGQATADCREALAGLPGRIRSHAGARAFDTVMEGPQVTVKPLDGAAASVWLLESGMPLPSLHLHGSGLAATPTSLTDDHLPAALEAVFSLRPGLPALRLPTALPGLAALLTAGLALPSDTAAVTVTRQLFWQWDERWRVSRRPAPPIQYQFSKDGRRHPRRPPKPEGIVYRRHIPWLDRTFTLRALDVERDLADVNRWMNEPTVAHFWQETGDLLHHRRYLSGIAQDPHTLGLIGCFDDQPFSYFEVYWAKEDRIAPFYDAADHDRGWHVLVGEPSLRGREFLTAWMPGVSHYLFLDDCRTQRLVIEPRIDNHRMIHSLNRCGYASLKEIEFPHKRAVLGMLLRERFFDDALWIPRGDFPFAVPHS